jgi:hypothetical protein
VSETWRIDGAGDAISGRAAQQACRDRLTQGVHETVFEGDTGSSLFVITNGDRAMVMLLRWPEDDGEHLGDTRVGETFSGGFVLSNGQHDTYPDADTVPLDEALQAVVQIIDGLPRSESQHWIIDRGDDAVDWRIQPED